MGAGIRVMTKNTADHLKLWQNFQENEGLSAEQLTQFQHYCDLLLSWNEQFNLTAITEVKGVITRHFADSLVLRRFLDLHSVSTVADIGSGAGFPGLPLKIVYPELEMVLIEVNHKKRRFLAQVIEDLKLQDVYVCDLDFRTFLRTSEGAVDLFLTRASLDPSELIRMFKPASPYRAAELVYWAAAEWEPSEKVLPYVRRVESYILSHKKRKLVFMSAGAPTQ